MQIVISVCEICARIHGPKTCFKVGEDGEAWDVCDGCQDKPFHEPTDKERALAKFRLANALEEAAKKLRQAA